MKNIIPYIVGFIMVIFTTIPPIDFVISAPGEWWPWMVVLSGFAAFYLWTLAVPWVIKVIAVGSFINCFLSSSPLISFTAYFSVIVCCYFYVLCYLVEDFNPVFKILQCVLLLNIFIFIMQITHHDPIFNFMNQNCYGIVGQHMQSASFAVILSATLIPYKRSSVLFPIVASVFCNSAGGFVSGIAGMMILMKKSKEIKIITLSLFLFFIFWLILSGKIQENVSMTSGRISVWISALKLSMSHFLFGWGIGTFKYIFPALGGMKTIPWITAHNCWIQLFFETGLIGFGFFLAYFVYLIKKLLKFMRRSILREKSLCCLAGLMMIAVNMGVAFPTRMIQTVPLIIFFLAYVQRTINYGTIKVSNC